MIKIKKENVKVYNKTNELILTLTTDSNYYKGLLGNKGVSEKTSL